MADERKSQQVGPTDIYIVRVKLNRAEAVNIPDFSPSERSSNTSSNRSSTA